MTSTGAIAAFAGKKTGRSPKDKRIVKEPSTENDIWWGSVNFPMTQKAFKMHESRCLDYLSSRPRLYVVDGYTGWDPKYRIKVRVVACRAYHALFKRNMLIVPTKVELEREFKYDSDYRIFNAGELSAGNLLPYAKERYSFYAFKCQ
jgi:phosphoenolpyruvate carboxykinase (ATP)